MGELGRLGGGVGVGDLNSVDFRINTELNAYGAEISVLKEIIKYCEYEK